MALDPLNRISIRRHLGLMPSAQSDLEPYIVAVEDGGVLQLEAAATIAAADAALIFKNASINYEDIDIIKAGTAEFDPLLKLRMGQTAYNNAVADMARALGLSFVVPSGSGRLIGFSMQ